MKTLFRLLRRLVVLVCIAAVLLTALPPLAREADRLLYPRKYSRQVEQWAAEYELDPLLVYAFIRTESGFDPAATSSVEARGLMQMTAAYHSGWGTVDNLLRMEEHSSDGQTLKGFPYNQMHHYVEKITASYAVYTRLYGG